MTELINAIKKELDARNEFLTKAPWAVLPSALLIWAISASLGCRHDVHTLSNSTAHVATVVIGLAAYLCAFLFFWKVRSQRLVLLLSAGLVMLLNFWEPIARTFAGNGVELGHAAISPMEVLCFSLGSIASIGLTIAFVVVFAKKQVAPNARISLMVSALSATTGLIAQGIFCPMATLGHLIWAHTGLVLSTYLVCWALCRFLHRLLYKRFYGVLV